MNTFIHIYIQTYIRINVYICTYIHTYSTYIHNLHKNSDRTYYIQTLKLLTSPFLNLYVWKSLESQAG